MDSFDMPVGLGMALAMNPPAMEKFATLPDEKKWQIVSGTHAVESREDMRKYVENILTAY